MRKDTARTTVGKSPGNRVEEPENGEDEGRRSVGFVCLSAETLCRLPRGEDELVRDENLGNAGSGEVAPLVARWDKGSDKTTDDHDELRGGIDNAISGMPMLSRRGDPTHIEEDDEDNVSSGKSGGEKQLEEEERGGDDPVDIPDVPDRAGVWVDGLVGKQVASVSDKLDVDGRGAEVARHRKVCEGSSEEDKDADVVERSGSDCSVAKAAGEAAGEVAELPAEGRTIKIKSVTQAPICSSMYKMPRGSN